MIDATVNILLEKISMDRYTLVLFGSKTCAPCKSMRVVASLVETKYPTMSFLYFDGSQNGAKELIKRFLVGVVPRIVIFRSGKQVGRILGMKTTEELYSLLDGLLKDGEILADPGDIEEVNRFTHRVIKAMDIDWSKYRGSERTRVGVEISEVAHDIIGKIPHWSKMSTGDIENLLRK